MKRPEFIAQQSAKPSGILGWIVAAVMERETRQTVQDAISLLGIKDGDSVLDVGTGSGISLGHIAMLTGNGFAIGVDHSNVMCRRAASNNRVLIAEGRVEVVCAPSDELPFPASAFDAAMSVHTLYFWNPIEPALLEIARVLRPGGTLVLAFRSDNDPAMLNFPESVYTSRPTTAVEKIVSRCGFERVRVVKRDPDAQYLHATRIHH